MGVQLWVRWSSKQRSKEVLKWRWKAIRISEAPSTALGRWPIKWGTLQSPRNCPVVTVLKEGLQVH
jgi:hypothetical protein